jgi:hypothetical protein
MAGLVDAELLSAAAAARPEPEPEPEPALAGQPPVTILSVAEATRRLRSVYRLPCHRRSRVSVGSDAWIDWAALRAAWRWVDVLILLCFGGVSAESRLWCHAFSCSESVEGGCLLAEIRLRHACSWHEINT